MHARYRIATSLGLASLLAAAIVPAAHAGGAYDSNSSSERTLGLGGGVLVQPKYEGSDEYEAVGFPIFIPENFAGDETSSFSNLGKRFSFKGIDDIRFRVLEVGPFEIGPVAGYRTGRDEDDADRLAGLGDIDGGLVLGGYAGIRFASILFDASAATQVSGDNTGLQVRFGAETIQQISPALELNARIGTTLASEEYMESYFGVSRAQFAASSANLQQYDTDAGFKDIHLELGLTADLTDKWVMKAAGRYARLIGDAADSPIVETEDQFSGRLGFAYRFSIDR